MLPTPPRGSQRDPDQARELQLVLDSEFLQAEYLEAQAAESPELQLVLEAEFL
jgi:hypothetical protein